MKTLISGLAKLASLIALALTTTALAGSSPNVLFIAIDDLRPDLECYGIAGAQSPNLDRFAEQGVLFTRHYTQVPTCGASRYALLTGRSPGSTRYTSGNLGFYQGATALAADPQDGAQSLPELFRRSGYRTVCLGKISHTPDGRVYDYRGRGDGRPELPQAWDELATPLGDWKTGWGAFFAYTGGRHREDGQGHRDVMEFVAESDEDLPDGLIAAEAVRKLSQLKDSSQPFFLGVGFFKPHLPFVATRGDWEAITNAPSLASASKAKPDSAWWHASSEFYQYTLPFPATHPLSEEAQRQSRRAYLACVRFADRQVGKVLDALRALNLEQNTIVVVWSDHGWHLGEQQIWGKHSPFERALRSVLMIRAPGVSRAGLRCDSLVETIDLYPTLIDLCQPSFTRTQYPLDGRSLRPLLMGAPPPGWDHAVSWWKDAVSVRTPTHRLIMSTRPGKTNAGVELYDLSSNPDNMVNIAAEEPELVDKLRRMGELPISP